MKAEAVDPQAQKDCAAQATAAGAKGAPFQKRSFSGQSILLPPAGRFAEWLRSDRALLAAHATPAGAALYGSLSAVALLGLSRARPDLGARVPPVARTVLVLLPSLCGFFWNSQTALDRCAQQHAAYA